MSSSSTGVVVKSFSGSNELSSNLTLGTKTSFLDGICSVCQGCFVVENASQP